MKEGLTLEKQIKILYSGWLSILKSALTLLENGISWACSYFIMPQLLALAPIGRTVQPGCRKRLTDT